MVEQLEVRVRSLDGQQLQLQVPSGQFRVADLKLRLQELLWPAPGVTQFHLFLRVSINAVPRSGFRVLTSPSATMADFDDTTSHSLSSSDVSSLQFTGV